MHINNAIIGHRGAAAYAPENTLSAFDKARSLGCNCMEFDVMLSQDAEPFVFHDESLKRTTNGRGKFGLVGSEYLKTLDAGKWFAKDFAGERILHFSEILHWLNDNGMQANIEIKPFQDTAEQTTLVILEHIKALWLAGKPWPLLSSFSREALYLAKARAKELPRALLMHSWDKDWLQLASGLECYSIHVHYPKLNPKRVKAIKDRGYQLFAYTVNRKSQADILYSWGVDACFSDYPDLMSV